MSESENPRTPPGAREDEGEGVSPEGTEGGAGAPDEGTGPGHSTPEISTEDQGGDQTGPLPGEHQGTPPKE